MKSRKLKRNALFFCLVVMMFSSLLVIAACNPSKPSGNNNGDSQGSTEFTWTVTTDCSICHAKEQASFANTALASSNHGEVTCVECHDNTTKVKAAHAKVTLSDTQGATRLKSTEVGSAICLTCHSYEELAVLSVENSTLTDNHGTKVNTHELNTLYNLQKQHNDVVCSSCHTLHATGNAKQSAEYTCISCHHDKVFECYTCHD